jgi:5,10-methenyltetrahydrofolate synthetase
MTTKKALRRAMLARRDALSPDERAARSAQAGARLLALPELEAADLVLFFVSFGSEIDTVPIVEQALRLGKRIAAPQADPQARVLILSMHATEDFVRRALKAGASGYLVKDSAPLELRMAIDAIGRGEVFVSSRVSSRMIAS